VALQRVNLSTLLHVLILFEAIPAFPWVAPAQSLP